MPCITIDLLGGFQIAIDGARVAALPLKAQALIAYLACQAKPVPRDKVAGVIWARSGDAQARQSLRQALFMLRQSFGDSAKESLFFGTANGGALSLTGAALDISMLNEARSSVDPSVLERAANSYRGEFLADFPSVSEEFDEWREGERSKYSALAADILERLAVIELNSQDPGRAIATARRLLDLDPFREDAHRLLMEIYARLGRKAEALRQYESCLQILREHLNTAPDQETTELARKLKSASPPAPPEAQPQPKEAAPPPVRHTIAIEKERRHLTIMFCDLAGSTALSMRLDPEELSELIDGYRTLAAETVMSFGGTVAQFLGDGILAYFGYPEAHENDAERAVSAGLEIVAKVETFSKQNGERLQVRVGIASGLVVIGDLSMEKLAVGETPNIAARLQTLAPLGSVVIAGDTLRLIGRLFEVQEIAVPNSSFGASSAYVVSGFSEIETRFDALQSSLPAPMVGREEESETILRRWNAVKQGSGQVILLSGEAGIGKSRLATHMLDCFGASRYSIAKLYCSPLQSQNALFPFTALVSRLAHFANTDNIGLRREKLMRLFKNRVFSRLSESDAALLSDLMGLGAAQKELARGDAQKKERIFRLVLEALTALGREGPVVVMLDDAHWIDATSLDLLNRLVSSIADSSILVMVTARPEFRPVWADQPHVTLISLGRLKKQHSTAMIASLAKGRNVSPGFADEIHARTDGVPLFIEELTKSLFEREDLANGGRGSLGAPTSLRAIPSSLQGSLLSRLDRLGESKRILQIGAAIGREFSYKLLQSVTGLEERGLTPLLHSAVDSGLVYVRGATPDSTYVFKHALVQDAAYETILKKQRLQLHAKIASTVLEDCKAKGVSHPEIVAHHLTLAEDYPAAIEQWLEFGKAQISLSSDLEAIAILNKALSLVDRVADRAVRNRLELQLRLAIVGSLVAVKGPPADEVAKCCERGLELAQLCNDPAPIFPFFYGRYVHCISRGNVRRSAGIASDLISTARSKGYKTGEVLGQRLLGLALIGLADFNKARQTLDSALNLYNPERDDHTTYRYGQNAKISSQTVLSLALSLLGDSERAIEIGEECIEAAEKLKHPHTLVIACQHYGCEACAMLGQWDKVYINSSKIISASKDFGLSYFQVTGNIYNGMARYKLGETGGITQMEKAIAALQGMSFLVGAPFYLSFVAEAKIERGLFREALALAEKAEFIMNSSEEIWIEPEVLSIKGQALLFAKPEEQALARKLMAKAILKAREIGSPTLEAKCLERRERAFKGVGIHDAEAFS